MTTKRLENGDRLPAVVADDLDGNPTTVSELTAGSWSTILFYRGHW